MRMDASLAGTSVAFALISAAALLFSIQWGGGSSTVGAEPVPVPSVGIDFPDVWYCFRIELDASTPFAGANKGFNTKNFGPQNLTIREPTKLCEEAGKNG